MSSSLIEDQEAEQNIAEDLQLLESSLLVLLENKDSRDNSDILNIVNFNLHEYLDILKEITKDEATGEFVSKSLVRIYRYLSDIKHLGLMGDSALLKDALEVTNYVIRMYSISTPDAMHESLDAEESPRFSG